MGILLRIFDLLLFFQNFLHSLRRRFSKTCGHYISFFSPSRKVSFANINRRIVNYKPEKTYDRIRNRWRNSNYFFSYIIAGFISNWIYLANSDQILKNFSNLMIKLIGSVREYFWTYSKNISNTRNFCKNVDMNGINHFLICFDCHVYSTSNQAYDIWRFSQSTISAPPNFAP